MQLSISKPLGGLMIALALALLLLPSTAVAHEPRQVGKYDFVVGWFVEPAFAGEKNGLDLRITDRATKEPVTDAQQTLEAAVLFGGQSRPLELRGVHNQPGHYTSDVVPTQVGHYRFHITGALGGEAVDQTFDSADGGFGEVESLSGIQFPAVAAASEATAPAPADQALARAADLRAQAAAEAASTALTLAIAAVSVGGLGLVLGVVSMVNSKRSD